MTCRHAAEKISYHSCISLVISLAAGMLNVGPGLAHTFSQLALELPFSRECELEADAVGLRIMSRACFEPSAAPRARRLSGREWSPRTTVPTESIGKHRGAVMGIGADIADAICAVSDPSPV